jgi:hypothetical protein
VLVSLAACGLLRRYALSIISFHSDIVLKGRQMSSVADTTPNGAPNNFQFLGRAEHTRVLTAKTRFCHTYEGSVREREPGDFSSISQKWRLPPLPQYPAVQYHRRCCLSAPVLYAALAPLRSASLRSLSRALSRAPQARTPPPAPRHTDEVYFPRYQPLTNQPLSTLSTIPNQLYLPTP